MSATASYTIPDRRHPGVPGMIELEQVDPATDPALEDVRAVLDAAAARLAAAGIDQWPITFLEEGARRMHALREYADRGEVWLMRLGHRPVGTVTISTVADPDFVTGWPSSEADAVYVSRLAVTSAPRRMGLRLGRWVLHDLVPFVAQVACNRNLIRLDCSRTNEKLHRYYEDAGFARVGTMQVPGRKSGALYQANLMTQQWRDAVRQPLGDCG